MASDPVSNTTKAMPVEAVENALSLALGAAEASPFWPDHDKEVARSTIKYIRAQLSGYGVKELEHVN